MRRTALKRRYRQLYERYEARLGAHDPRHRDQLIAKQVLVDQLQTGSGQHPLSHADKVQAAQVVGQGETAQELKRSQGQRVAIQYVEQLVISEAGRLERAYQQCSRGFDLER